jgi:uncharacterized membrane protein YbhN (UPF0104 family)
MMVGIIYLYLNRHQLAVLKQVNSEDIIILSVLTLLFFYITGYTFKLLVSLMNVDLSVTETIGLSILTNFGNYLGPIRPGAALKAMYLKSSRGLAYTKFTSVLAANTFLALLMTGSAGIILLFLLIKENLQIPTLLFFICAGLIIGSMLPFIYKTPHIKTKGRITELLQSTLEGFAVIRTQQARLSLICLNFMAQFFVAALINKVTFNSLGISITFLSALTIGVFTSIANLITITPNNLGVQEAVIAYLFTITGFDFSTGIIGAGLARVIHMIITFALTPVFAHYLLKSTNLSLGKLLNKK